MEPKKKPYITQLEEKVELYQKALDAHIAWTEAEEKVSNTAYKRDAEKLAEVAKQKAMQAITAARSYGG